MATTGQKVLLSVGSIAIAGAALVGGMLFMCARWETPTTHYATYSQAVADGAIRRGWIPAFVPVSATDIVETHNIDTNYQWLEFTASPRDLEKSTATLEKLSLYEARRSGFESSWFTPSPPPELRKNMLVTARASLRFFRSKSAPFSLCLVVDWSTGRCFAWSCTPATAF